ncbi:MAG: helix-turn-helix transcriptional regulator [Bariatricus sp.]
MEYLVKSMNNKGEIFKKIREYLGLSQKAMGDKMGCSAAKIRRCETGEREITDEIIQSMCESCNVDKRVFDDPDHIEEYCNYVPEVIDYRSIGERVRELRKEKKLIQKDFGEKVGSSPSAIFKIETHLNHATDKTLHDIADTFDVGFEWLKFGDERYRKSPVNRKLIEWLMVHQEIRDQLWKKMMDEEQN